VKVLALEPFYGGSHRAFLDGWAAHSRHDWTVLGLSPHHWKWRMRHGAITLAERVTAEIAGGAAWDCLLCSDMLDLAAFRGLAPAAVARLPAVAYFHENQLTYPVREERERDHHFAFTNLTTALAADAVWFNSAFHRDAFLGALPDWLRRMPDHAPLAAVDAVRAKAAVHPPGIDPFPPRPARAPGPLRILWAARWEHDKGPDDLLAALDLLAARGVDFRLAVIGEGFAEVPPAFPEIERRFAARIDHWGYQEGRAAYRACLAWADVIVSTAHHEFFGLAVAEAAATGCLPLLPPRLAYPELFPPDQGHAASFYDGTPAGLAEAFTDAAQRLARDDLWQGDPHRARRAVERFTWPILAPQLDAALASVTRAQTA
jgi:glycosyltransferase involved in cell wall biosynthesis